MNQNRKTPKPASFGGFAAKWEYEKYEKKEASPRERVIVPALVLTVTFVLAALALILVKTII